MENININKQEVLDYFTTMLTDKEIWKEDKEKNKITAYSLHGALVFANIFGLISYEEMENFLNLDFEK